MSLILPQPQQSQTWQQWAGQLVLKLAKAIDPTAFRARRVQLASIQNPTEDGIVLLVEDATGGPTLVVSLDGDFIDVRTGVPVV